jgi:hypothetical protein
MTKAVGSADALTAATLCRPVASMKVLRAHGAVA